MANVLRMPEMNEATTAATVMASEETSNRKGSSAMKHSMNSAHQNTRVDYEQAITDSYDATIMMQHCIDDLGALFVAIKDAATDGSNLQRLAGVGQYLADDWSGMNQANVEKISVVYEQLKAARRQVKRMEVAA